MTTAAQTLAAFAAGLEFDALPAPVVERAQECILDTVAVAAFGSTLPWSRAVADFALRSGAGKSSLIGRPGLRVSAAGAALANGTAAHAFEQDSLRFPGAGVHPGAALVPAILALAEEEGADGRAVLAAFVAGCEAMFRIGLASRHSSEALGFHAPGVTGPYGAAIAAGRILGLDARQMADAIGIAGSLGGGLLAFSKAQTGATVKRLHLGRAAEAGVLAARLAQSGFAGPETVLEGRYGFLQAYCRESDAARLTAELGSRWETLAICFKRYPCHVTAHTPVQAVRDLMAEHGFAGKDVADVTVAGSDKLVSHHDIPEPRDLGQAQYSVPFCVALALFRDPADPASYDEGALADPAIRAACRAVKIEAAQPPVASAWATRVMVRLKDGRSFTREAERFRGMPGDVLPRAELEAKFMRLAATLGEARARALWSRLANLEREPRIELE
jgi:2-methylcitrate dehydratase PrpD